MSALLFFKKITAFKYYAKSFVIIILVFTSCITVPKETVTISKTIGSDLVVLENSHKKIVQLYYSKLKTSINTFIDDTYAPYVINYVLKKQLAKYQQNQPSLYTSLMDAAKTVNKDTIQLALDDMSQFQQAAYAQISKKRKELMDPIVAQETELTNVISQSYSNTIYANTTLTAYLQSIRKVKETQQEALSKIGLKNVDSLITTKLVDLSNILDKAIQKGKEIDVKGDKAKDQIEDVINKIKELTNKK